MLIERKVFRRISGHMNEHEILWESLRSMHRSEQVYRQKLMINEFLVKIIEGLSNRLNANPFSLLFKLIQEQIPLSEVFILHLKEHDHATVFKSTLATEGHLWPTIGPFRRTRPGTGVIIFNTKLIPVFGNFCPSSIMASPQW